MKICHDGGYYYISTKQRFNTVRELLEFYRSDPITCRRIANEREIQENIFLLQPIPVDAVLEQRHKQLLEEKGKSLCKS